MIQKHLDKILFTILIILMALFFWLCPLLPEKVVVYDKDYTYNVLIATNSNDKQARKTLHFYRVLPRDLKRILIGDTVNTNNITIIEQLNENYASY